MQIFKTEKPNIRYYIFKSCITIFPILLFIFLIASLFSFSFDKETIGIILLVSCGVTLLDESRHDRIQEIKFDEINQEIIFSYKNMFYIPKQKKIPFETANLDVDLSKEKGIDHKSNIRSLWFSHTTGWEIQVNQSNDGFSTESLMAICKTATALNIHIRTNKGRPLPFNKKASAIH